MLFSLIRSEPYSTISYITNHTCSCSDGYPPWKHELILYLMQKKKNQTAIHVYINNVHASPTLTLLAVYQASSALLMQDGVSVSLSDDPSPSSPSSSPVLMVMKCANPSSTINSSGSFFISLPFLPQGLRSSSSLSTNPTHRQCTIAAVRSLLLFFIYLF